jgi:hypothetical protein
MKREEIAKLSGRELMSRLNDSWKKGDITMAQYKAILDYWENNREMSQTEKDIKEVFDC